MPKRWAALALLVILATVGVFGVESIQASLRQGSNRHYLSGTAQNLNWILTYCSLAAYLSYFMLSVGVHENHLFIGTVLAVAAAALAAERTMRAILIVAMSTLNLITVYGLTGEPFGFAPVVGIDVSVIFAAVNVVLFLVFWVEVVRPDRRLSPSG